MSKKDMRLESKKRKVEALLNIAALNDADKTDDKKPKKSCTPETKGAAEKDNGESVASKEGESLSTREQIERCKEEYRARRALVMTIPKLFLTLDKLNNSASVEDEDGAVAEKFDPLLFCSDLQTLLRFCLEGNLASRKPRWCSLLRVEKVKNTLIIAVDDVGVTELEKYRESFPYLYSKFDESVDMVCPMQYEKTIRDELFNVHVTRRNLIRDLSQSNGEDHAASAADQEDPVYPCTRTDLLLSPQQLVQENFPMPVVTDRFKNFVYSTGESYEDVGDESPMYAVDCEMCLGSNMKHVLTRVAVVDEHLNVVYDTLVKPDVKIINYLTKYSGITKKMLEPVTTTLKDVQEKIRKLIPPNAILCGQSLNSDLHALQMFHPYVIDTSVIYNLTGLRWKKTSLRNLAAKYLGKAIQNDAAGHNPCEDAITTMELVNLKLAKGLQFGDVTVVAPPARVTDDSEKEKIVGACPKMTSNKSAFFGRYGSIESIFRIAKVHKKSTVVIGREDDITPYKEETDTVLAETDKIIAKQVKSSYENYNMTYCNLNGFTRCLNEELTEDAIKTRLSKLDHRLKKMTKDLKPGTVVTIVFTGRTVGEETHNAKVFVHCVKHSY